MISTGFSGVVGGMSDIGGHKFYDSMSFSDTSFGGGTFDSPSKSFSDSFSGSWWNQYTGIIL
jgi:hypothetical protein